MCRTAPAPPCTAPPPRAVHEEVVKLDLDFGAAAGVVTDAEGRVHALWGSFSEQVRAGWGGWGGWGCQAALSAASEPASQQRNQQPMGMMAMEMVPPAEGRVAMNERIKALDQPSALPPRGVPRLPPGSQEPGVRMERRHPEPDMGAVGGGGGGGAARWDGAPLGGGAGCGAGAAASVKGSPGVWCGVMRCAGLCCALHAGSAARFPTADRSITCCLPSLTPHTAPTHPLGPSPRSTACPRSGCPAWRRLTPSAARCCGCGRAWRGRTLRALCATATWSWPWTAPR